MGITNARVIEELIRRALLSELEPSLTVNDRVELLLDVSGGDAKALHRASARIRETNRDRPSFLGEQAASHLDLAIDRLAKPAHATPA